MRIRFVWTKSAICLIFEQIAGFVSFLGRRGGVPISLGEANGYNQDVTVERPLRLTDNRETVSEKEDMTYVLCQRQL